MRYRIRKWNFLVLLLLTTLGIQAQTVEFKAAAPNAVVVGEQFRLTYSVNSEARDIRVAELPDFDILMGPTSSYSSSTMISNGKTVHETSYTFTYILMAKKEGTFNIPPASVKVKNSTYTSNALVVNVLPQDKKTEAEASNSSQQRQANGSESFVVMSLSKRNVYEQEAILVSFKLYTTQAITNITQMKFPEFEGFLVQEIEIPDLGQQKLENYQGKNYSTLLLKQALLYPQRSGTLKIDEGTFDVTIRVRTSQRVNSFFDDFFDSYRNVSKTITSKGSSIEVKPLPAGKPASYGGAVGDFKMEASISSNQVKANEAVTVNVKISGTGNVRLVKNPEVTFPNDFDIYDPKVDVNTRTTTAGVTGSKTIEYMAIPRYGGEFEIPAIQFSYFDPKAGTYKTLSAGPYPLRVEAPEGG
ncbi:BatD family protein [Parabacteroides sp. OttesenSCG-928-N08]|nr:BatD family protein [Parabacteroides sp. OttesenSCG-928-N08]